MFQSPQGGSETRAREVQCTNPRWFQSPQGGSETSAEQRRAFCGSGFNPLKAGRKLVVAIAESIAAAVSIPSRRVGNTRPPATFPVGQRRFNPLKAGRKLNICQDLTRRNVCFNPLKAGRKRLSWWVLFFVGTCFNPLKAGRKPLHNATQGGMDDVFQSPQGGSETPRSPGLRLLLLGFNPLKAGRKRIRRVVETYSDKVSIPSRRVGN